MTHFHDTDAYETGWCSGCGRTDLRVDAARVLTQDECDVLGLDGRENAHGDWALDELDIPQLDTLFEWHTRKSYTAYDVQDIVAAMEAIYPPLTR